MDDEITVNLPRAEADVLRRIASQLGVSVSELASKMVSDELDQRCRVAIGLAKIIDIRGPEKGRGGE